MNKNLIIIIAFIATLLISPVIAVISAIIFIFLYLGWNSLKRLETYEGVISSIESLKSQRDDLVKSAEIKIEECIELSQESEDFFNQRAYQPYWDTINKWYIEMQSLKDIAQDIQEIEKSISTETNLSNYIKEDYLIDKKIYWPLAYFALKNLEKFVKLIDGKLNKKEVKTKEINNYDRYTGHTYEKPPQLNNIFKLKKPLEDSTKKISSTLYKAERDYQFSSIYQQIKTNKILEKGFNSLNDTINKLSLSVIDKLQELSNSIEKIDKSMDSLHAHIDSLHETMSEKENLSIKLTIKERK